MTDETMDLDSYLARGGRLTSPQGLPPRYRAELLRLMARFVDSSLAGAAEFADTINHAPGISERVAAARIVLEKTEHAEQVLRLMGEFGADVGRYASNHPWTRRLPRDAAPGARHDIPDQRLPVFAFPVAGWIDAVTMNLVVGTAAGVQLADLEQVSYQPLADAFRSIAPREARHTKLASQGLTQLMTVGTPAAAVQQSLEYWVPRVAIGFGSARPERLKLLMRFGLRHVPPDAQIETWRASLAAALSPLGLRLPD